MRRNRAAMSFDDCLKSAKAAHRRLGKLQTQEVSLRGRGMLGGFKGASHNRLTLDWVASRVPADEEIRTAMGRIRARAREQSRNNPYVQKYLNLLKDNVIGPDGIKLQAKVKNNDGRQNKLFNERIETAWLDWGKKPTLAGDMDLVEFEKICLKTVATDGEVYVHLVRAADNPYAFALEAWDPDLVDEEFNRPRGSDQNEVRMGIELTEDGRRVAYHVWNNPMGYTYPQGRRIERVRVPADQVIHLYHPDRVNQTRGISWLASVLFYLRMIDGYEESEVVGARLASSALGVFTRKEGMGGTYEQSVDGYEVAASPGEFIFAPDGYELSTWDPQRPSSNYAAFVKACLRKVASGLGIPYNVLANDLEGVNYSSMRSGTLVERDFYRSRQRWWIGSFKRPVYEAWIQMSLLSGGLTLDTRLPQKFLDVNFVPRGWPWVDPEKDVDAGIKEIQMGLSSRTDILARQGKDYEDNLELLAEEKKLAEEYGVDVAGPQEATGSTTATGAGTSPPAEETDEEPEARHEVLVALKAGRNGHARR